MTNEIGEVMNKEKNVSGNEISLVTKGKSLINARITIFCPICKYKRVFKNQFTHDKMDLVLVTIKIVDWMTCETCGEMLSNTVEFEV